MLFWLGWSLVFGVGLAQNVCYRVTEFTTEHTTVLSNLPFTVMVGVQPVYNDSAPLSLKQEFSYQVIESSRGKLLKEATLSMIQEENKEKVLRTQFEVEIEIPNGQATIQVRVLPINGFCGYDASEFEATIDLYGIPGVLALLPPLFTLMIAMLTRHVLFSLYLGVLLGSIFINRYNPLLGLARSLDSILPTALADEDHAVVLLFCWMLSGMVAIISKSGGAAGLAKEVIQRANSSFSGQLCTWCLGLVIFFDDYACALITGNTVRPIADRLHISREKLAFLVDGTAAPIASIAPISSWIGFELSLIKDEFKKIGLARSEYIVFLETIPMRYYSIFLIIFVIAMIITRKDFGPMLKAERARNQSKLVDPEENEDNRAAVDDSAAHNPIFDPIEGIPLRWYNAVVPVGAVIAFTLIGLMIDGTYTISKSDNPNYSFQNLFAEANSFRVLMWSGLVSYLVPLGMYWYQRILTPKETTEYWIEGMKELMEPALILVLAWSLGNVVKDLQLSSWLVTGLEGSISIQFLPTIIFLSSGFMSFCTGSSWSTMSIMFPIVVPLAWNIGHQDYNQLLQCIASVLAGSVFGDHCSPISDTTILVSLATKCSVTDHIKTQIPYAFVVACVSVCIGTLPTAISTRYDFFYSHWLAVPLGAFFIVSIIWIFGTRVEDFSERYESIEEHPIAADQYAPISTPKKQFE